MEKTKIFWATPDRVRYRKWNGQGQTKDAFEFIQLKIYEGERKWIKNEREGSSELLRRIYSRDKFWKTIGKFLGYYPQPWIIQKEYNTSCFHPGNFVHIGNVGISPSEKKKKKK